MYALQWICCRGVSQDGGGDGSGAISKGDNEVGLQDTRYHKLLSGSRTAKTENQCGRVKKTKTVCVGVEDGVRREDGLFLAVGNYCTTHEKRK